MLKLTALVGISLARCIDHKNAGPLRLRLEETYARPDLWPISGPEIMTTLVSETFVSTRSFNILYRFFSCIHLKLCLVVDDLRPDVDLGWSNWCKRTSQKISVITVNYIKILFKILDILLSHSSSRISRLLGHWE